MKTKNITRLIGTGLLKRIIVCIILLIGSFTSSMARGRHSVSRRPHYTHRNHVYRTFRPTRGTVFLTRPRGGRYHYIGKHRYWMADNVLYDIVPMGKKGIQYVVIKVVK